MALIPLEDNFTDIVGKAQRGLNLSGTALAGRAGVSLAQLNALKAGAVDEAALRKVAGALGLGAEALVTMARGAWRPREAGEVAGLGCFNTAFDDMTVNAYVAFDPGTRRAAAFDTGADCGGMLEFIREQGLEVEVILLTHTHTDHVFDLDRLKAATGARAWVSGREALAGAETFADGKVFEVGRASRPSDLTDKRAGRPLHSGIEDRDAADERACAGRDDVCGDGAGAASWRWWGMRCLRGRWAAGWWIMMRRCGRIARGFLRCPMRRFCVPGTGR